jgi:hypothetical protein
MAPSLLLSFENQIRAVDLSYAHALPPFFPKHPPHFPRAIFEVWLQSLKGKGIACSSKSFQRTGLADMALYGAPVSLFLFLLFTLSLKLHICIGVYKVLRAPLQFAAAPV